ncbi:MAG TPA: hypothetical protein VGG97_14440 [Bryobacteraceae bacterium]
MSAQDQRPASLNAAQLLDTVIQAGAYAEAFTQFCESGNRMAAARDQAQLRAWAQRNHWSAVQARLNADPALQTKFTSQKRLFVEGFAAHGLKTALACGLLPQELTSPAHDPSLKYSAELQMLDNAPSANFVPSPATPAESASGVPAAAPPALPATGSSGFVVPTTGEAANVPAGNPITVGSVTFTPPAGWRVTENTSQRATLQAATQHTKAVLFIEQLPLSGDFRSAFGNALRTQSPVTGLKLQYPQEGVTGGGSPMIHVRDNGTLRGGRQNETIDAVGVALGNTMLLSELVSGDWGGDNFGFQRAFEKIVSNWKLTGEKGTAWDPVNPPPPVGARSGFFFGARLQNQLNPLGGMDLNAVREYLILLPTGQAFKSLPFGGRVLDMNFAAECTRLPHACGTYRMEGSRINFTWRGEYGLVTHDNSQFDRGSGGGKASVANFNGTRVFETAPVQNLRISGRYTSTFASVGSTAFHSASVVAQTFINFSPDGTYQKSGFSAASFTGTGAAGTVQEHKGVQTGRYTLNGYALTLAPSGGEPPETFTTVFEAVNPSLKAIFINDKAFLRDGR